MSSIFLGVHGEVVALDRTTGQELWHTKLTGGDFVNLLLDQDRIIATTKGKAFCLDAATGQLLWRNDLPGPAWGWSGIATARGSTSIGPLSREETSGASCSRRSNRRHLGGAGGGLQPRERRPRGFEEPRRSRDTNEAIIVGAYPPGCYPEGRFFVTWHLDEASPRDSTSTEQAQRRPKRSLGWIGGSTWPAGGPEIAPPSLRRSGRVDWYPKGAELLRNAGCLNGVMAKPCT